MKINSLYVCVKDMTRAISFYEKFFGKKVDVPDERFTRFDIGGFSFGLYDPNKDNEEVVHGNNIVPNIKVDDAEKEYERVKQIGAKIILEILDINEFKLFQFEDTEGNVIEVYSNIKL
ncbi:MAG: VOC family protein [Patescibacteria group bacterium]